MRRLLAFIFCLLVGMAAQARAALYSVGLDKKDFTSDFMIGKVVVSVIFVESDGTTDPNLENWSDDRKEQALSKIMAGLDWWTRQNTNAPLSFTFVSQTLTTKYEPITRPYYDESLWIPDVLSKLGYQGSRFAATHDYVNDLRAKYGTDWGFVIYVVDSLNDTNGKFADGLFAYSYLGGPYIVMTYDNDGYGITNMDVVAAHETGHIFHALDEYAGASSPNDYSYGYFSTINGNHVYSSIANEPNSIMRGGLRWGLDKWARDMIGWRDLDNNNLADILDPLPKASLASQMTQAGPTDPPSFSGEATVSVLPRQGNSQGFGFTIDSISKVEYRLKSGDWAAAVPADGVFDSGDEDFKVTLPSSQLGSQSVVQSKDIELKVTTSLSSYKTSNGTRLSSSGKGSLNDASIFPNPFKPNSQLGHTQITFKGLPGGSKIRIFTAVGEPVFDTTLNVSDTLYNWRAKNDDGSDVASGVYYYLISAPDGSMKKGKLAIIK